MEIEKKTIPHSEQRYETCGDWWVETDEHGRRKLCIRVSDLGDWRMEAAIGLHEEYEALLCLHGRVKGRAVDEFDKHYEAAREREVAGDAYKRVIFGSGFLTLDSEPGDHPDAPYRWEHSMATIVERLFIDQCSIDWINYEEAIHSLPPLSSVEAFNAGSSEQ